MQVQLILYMSVLNKLWHRKDSFTFCPNERSMFATFASPLAFCVAMIVPLGVCYDWGVAKRERETDWPLLLLPIPVWISLCLSLSVYLYPFIHRLVFNECRQELRCVIWVGEGVRNVTCMVVRKHVTGVVMVSAHSLTRAALRFTLRRR